MEDTAGGKLQARALRHETSITHRMGQRQAAIQARRRAIAEDGVEEEEEEKASGQSCQIPIEVMMFDK